MSGPIVRTGASPEFSKGWDRIFGDQPKAGKKTDKKADKKKADSKPKAEKAKAAAAKKPKKKAGKKK
ncbi:MAG: RNA polymerase subunit sigma [Planctomycetaceae bacterium]|nr:RNA polymerase subunit sigma [Planctomycetaceae bacterium]